MTDPTPLTPASEALLSELTLDETPEGAASWRRSVVAIEQAAAARAVDEALSGLATLADPGSGGYVRIERGTTGWTLNCEGGDTGPWHEGDTIRDAIAAALVAHLRGPR